MAKQMIRIVAAVVDTENLVLYMQNGDKVTIPQGDPRVRRIVDEITVPLDTQGWADVNVAHENAEEDSNAYDDFQKKSSGVVRLFRIAKRHLTNFFKQGEEATPVANQTLGHLPTAQSVKNMKAAVDEILANATPVSDPRFHEVGLDTQARIAEDNGVTPKEHTPDRAQDTIVAVVDGKILPGMEKIRNQFSRASKLGSTVGVENFLKRLAGIIDKRSHSVEDLLKFMERGDLPIADDGSILVYKVLNRGIDGKFKDCHTSRVPQWVGAYVCMDESLVDPVRSNECSNGLHIARRGYVGGFGGNTCVLAKVAPEDVITVPAYDANKMRACGYHIIAELTPDQFTLLKRNQPLTLDEAGAKLLAAAIKGLHPGRTHEIRITGQKGQGVVVKELQDITPTMIPPSDEPVAPVAALADKEQPQSEPVLDPKRVLDNVQISRKERAAALAAEYARVPSQANYDALMAYKKGAKVSWDKLGIPEPKAFDPLALVATSSPAQATPPAAAAKKPPKGKKKAKKPLKKAPGKPVVKRKPVPASTPQPEPTKASAAPPVATSGSYKDRIRALLDAQPTTKAQAEAILALKKEAKKSWLVLGVSLGEQKMINTLMSQGT